MNLRTNSLQRNRWRENSLEIAEDDGESRFTWATTKKFLPYIADYKGWTFASLSLMLAYTALNLSNPFLIGLAIDQFISQNNLEGLGLLSVVLIVVNVLMWQGQYWQGLGMGLGGPPVLFHPQSGIFYHPQSPLPPFFE